MADAATEWFYVGQDGQPVGPLSLEAMLDAWVHERIHAETPCAYRGMEGWQPLGETPPFTRFRQRIADGKLVSYGCKCGNRIIMSAEHAGSLARCKSCNTVFMVPDPPGHDEPRASTSQTSESEA
jgi:hypothetical protein